MELNHQSLNAWLPAWNVVDGDIACALCGRRQSLTASPAEFQHASTCEVNALGPRKRPTIMTGTVSSSAPTPAHPKDQKIAIDDGENYEATTTEVL